MSNQTIKINVTKPFTVITIVLVILKLTHVIDWSWWGVTAFIWVPLAFFWGSAILAMICMGIYGFFNPGSVKWTFTKPSFGKRR